jgi:hypothetical protein
MLDRLATLWVATKGVCRRNTHFGWWKWVVGMTIIGIPRCNACVFLGHLAFGSVDVSSMVLNDFDSKTL